MPVLCYPTAEDLRHLAAWLDAHPKTVATVEMPFETYKDALRAAWLRNQALLGLPRYAELGVRVATVLEQNAVRAPEDCAEVSGFMKHASSTGVALMQTIAEWMKGEPQG